MPGILRPLAALGLAASAVLTALGASTPRAVADPANCALTRSVTDPDTGYVYSFPVDNPIPPGSDPTACDGDHGDADQFAATQQSDGQWVYGPPPSVEPGFAAVPAMVTSCPPIIQYSARGTREDLDAADGGLNPPKWWSRSGLPADHGAGVVGGAVYDRLAAVEPAGSVGLYADYYPADYLLTNADITQIAGQYTASVTYGAQKAVADLNTLHASCPASHLLVTGYSQGADAIRRALADPGLSPSLSSANTLVELFGDPNFQPAEQNQPGTGGYDSTKPAFSLHGAFTSGHSGIENAGHAFIPAPGQIPARFTVSSWCHDQDPACQGDAVSIDQHLTYGAQDGYSAAFTAARFFASAVTPASAVPTASTLGSACVSHLPGTTQVQIAFDNTGSASPATYDGTVGYSSNGTITPTSASTTQTVPAHGTATWTQNLPFVLGQTHFLFDVSDRGVTNPDALTPTGTHPEVLLDEGFHDPLC